MLQNQEQGINGSRSEAAIAGTSGTSAYDTHGENLKIQII